MLVSVVIPTYNRRELLEDAVNSVRAQSSEEWELIIVDDGSTDSTRDAEGWDDVHYIRTPHCGLPGRVRNIGVNSASGEFLAFLDSDDRWEPDKLARQIAFLRDNPDIPLCHTREKWIREGKVISQSKQRHRRAGDIFADALKKCIIGPSTVMLRRELFVECGGFHEGLEIAEDYELWLRICSLHEVGYLDEPLVIKRGGRPDQLSSRYGQIEIFRLQALKENVNRGSFHGENLNLALAELSRKCRIYAAGCRKRSRPGEAENYLLMAEEYDRRIR